MPDLSKMKFLDIDDVLPEREEANRIQDAIDHFKEHHDDVWVRKSANGNLHAITYSDCEICNLLNDKNFHGRTLFDNRGSKWAEFEWKNPQTGDVKLFDSTSDIHFIEERLQTDEKTGEEVRQNFHHYFLSFDSLRENISNITQYAKRVFYTFHLAVCKNIDNIETQDESHGGTKHIEQWVQELEMKEYKDDIGQVYADYVNFVKTIPPGFKYNVLKRTENINAKETVLKKFAFKWARAKFSYIPEEMMTAIINQFVNFMNKILSDSNIHPMKTLDQLLFSQFS